MGYCTNPNSYICKVKTADVAGAGTNADIGVIFYGTAGNSPVGAYWVLDNDGDDNEQGDEDWYCIPMEPIGEPHTISIRFDPTGQTDSPNWRCEWIELCYPNGDTLKRWEVNREFTEFGWTDIGPGGQFVDRQPGKAADMKQEPFSVSEIRARMV